MEERLAKIGYDAYGSAADWKAYNGEPMPQWDALPPHIQDRWKAAAVAMKNEGKEEIQKAILEAFGK